MNFQFNLINLTINSWNLLKVTLDIQLIPYVPYFVCLVDRYLFILLLPTLFSLYLDYNVRFCKTIGENTENSLKLWILLDK